MQKSADDSEGEEDQAGSGEATPVEGKGPGSGANPNGDISWFNTGLESGGWNPPFLGIGDLHYVNLEDAQAEDFDGCKAPGVIGAFEAASKETGRK